MKCAAVLLALAWALSAVEIPAGTNLEVRLTKPVSTSSSHVKDRASGIIIAPVVAGESTVIPAGTQITGTVTAIAAPSETSSASLTIQFTQVLVRGIMLRVATRVSGIDNARETVNESGAVQGISPKDTITGRLDQGLGKLSAGPLGGLAQVLEAAKGLLIENADPNITYVAGTELTLRFVKPLTMRAALKYPALPAVPDDGHLSDLVNNQVAQTYAVHPDRPSDITNLMFIGNIDVIQKAFQEAGWGGSDVLTGKTKWETARAIIEQRGFREAPVSTIVLNHRAPDLVLQKANNTFSARHHLRLWHSPDTYQGQEVWLGAATHDIGIDYSDRDRTFFHKIDSNIDLERRKVANDLIVTGKARAFTTVARPTTPTDFRNATGDDVNTDGRMAVLQF